MTQKRTIASYKELFQAEYIDDTLLVEAEADERAGVRRLAAQYRTKVAKREAEKARFCNMFVYERQLAQKGCRLIAGVDEAGRGPLAGPVAIGACILPKDCFLEKLNDSKKLSEKQRDILYDKIIECAIAWKVVFVSEDEIDMKNIYQATVDGMYRAIEDMTVKPDGVLIDAVPLGKLTCPNESLIKGDQKSASIAAASILAKVSRDRLMTAYDKQYPMYGFAKHKGYGTADHIAAIRAHSVCPIHRKTFDPIASIIREGQDGQ